MSVHILDDNHLSAVLRFAFSNTWTDTIDREVTERMVQEIADELARVNDLSYATNYPSAPVSAEFITPVVNWDIQLPTPIEFLKLLQNVEHQLCEAPNFFNTEAFRFINNYRSVAIAKLDGYNDAAWEIGN